MNPDSPLRSLWDEYQAVFRDFDDLTLARWMAQTLGQLEGRAWRFSHPLMGAYHLAAQAAHDRQIWLQRLATMPHAYAEAPCCRAPVLPLLTREVGEAGLACPHCGGTLASVEEIPAAPRQSLVTWTGEYARVHAVAHWDDARRESCGDYEHAFDGAALEAETLLGRLGGALAPQLLEFYPAVIWEDQDECLEVRPEDVRLE